MLETRELGFGYDQRSSLFDGYTESFAAGEMVALTGCSGRGKSTLLYLLGLMMKPDRGAVVINGADASSLGDAARAHLRADLIGFVFQDACLDSTRTIIDNVLETCLYRSQPRSAARSRALALLESFGVESHAESRPARLSGGQAGRIALCRALLNDPAIILADEPTGNLDDASAAIVTEAFRARAAAGAIVVVATHDSTLVALCDRHVVL
ncbi:ATP-binding cassette domain-containing protein [Subtercola sp. PAMC28395]|nr:ATP-binding cassette domain-containing protein [Subtercola sp. PAMC28395]